MSLADWLVGRRTRSGLGFADVGAYVVAQVVGEVVATAGLLSLIFSLARSHRATISAPAVGAYIGAAYWFTSSTSFANPAITIGRMLSDTFAGIAPSSAPVFIAAQVVGGAVGACMVHLLYPRLTSEQAARIVLPHPAGDATPVIVHDPGGPTGVPG